MSVIVSAVPFPIGIFGHKAPIFQKIPVDKFVYKQLYIVFLLTNIH